MRPTDGLVLQGRPYNCLVFDSRAVCRQGPSVWVRRKSAYLLAGFVVSVTLKRHADHWLALRRNV